MKKRYWLWACLPGLVFIGLGFALRPKEVGTVLGYALLIVSLLFTFGPLIVICFQEGSNWVEGFLRVIALGVVALANFSGCSAVGLLAKGCSDSTHRLPEATAEVQFGLFFVGIFLFAAFVGFFLKDYFEP
jgi:hypothetical protein